MVNAAGAWSPAIHGLIDGVGPNDRLPLFSVEHQWSLTAPLDGLDPLPSHTLPPPQKYEHQTWRAAVSPLASRPSDPPPTHALYVLVVVVVAVVCCCCI